MGTQQILMIVLSVIVVGAAVAVGIQMFDVQATNAQKTAIGADLQNFAGQVLAYMRTPASMGGGKGLDEPDLEGLAKYMGFTEESNTKLTNGNATYEILSSSSWDIANGVVSGYIKIQGKSLDGKTDMTVTIEVDPTKEAKDVITTTVTK